MKQVNRAVFSLLLLLVGCSEIACFDVSSEVIVEDLDADFVEVRFDIGKVCSLRSAVSPVEDEVFDLNLCAYADGKLVAAEYYKEEIRPLVKLLYGHKYNLYAIANVGNIDPPLNECEFRSECQYRIGGIEDMSDSVPMVWKLENYTVGTLGERVCIRLERLVAKLLFSVDMSALKGLKINSVRLRQSPNVVWPFKYDGGSFVTDKDEVFDCDYASESDIEALNLGNQVHFYILENCQGEILPDNTDPWAKVPENIPDKKELCTYLEVECTFAEGFFYSGEVTYRLYLGQDSTSDFNVRRNTVLNASLYLTDDAFAEISWRVESDVSVNDGYAGGWLSRGLHSMDDLYVGERFVYSVIMASEMMTHLDGDVENARLCVMGTDEVIQFGQLKLVEEYNGSCQCQADALCLRPANGVLCLMDANNKLLTVLDDFVVQKPFLVATESPPYGDRQYVESDVPQLDFYINGKAYDCDLYLVDADGYNLNNSQGCGFETSLFDVSVMIDGLGDKLAETLDLRVERNDAYGRFATFYAACRNQGNSNEIKTLLMECVTQVKEARVKLVENNFDFSRKLNFYLNYMPITLTLVDNGWAGYADCQLSMEVDNPSELPIQVQCWQSNMALNEYNATERNKIVGLYGVKYSRVCYDYVCGAFSSSQLPIYCSRSAFMAYDSGVYPLPELSTDMIRYALLYDYMTQNALLHQVDAVFQDGSPIYELQIVNKLSDGSMKFDYIYGSDLNSGGLNDRGIWLYTGGYLLSKADTELDGFPGVTPESLSELLMLNDAHIAVSYNAENKNICASVTSNALVGTKLNTEIVVNASGYVQTTPNGTWGKKVDNYCSAKISKTVKNVVLGSNPTVIDSNALKEAMNAIYSQTFTDSYNMIGSSNSYQHSAHPTSLTVSLRFSLGDGYSESMVPIVLDLPT